MQLPVRRLDVDHEGPRSFESERLAGLGPRLRGVPVFVKGRAGCGRMTRVIASDAARSGGDEMARYRIVHWREIPALVEAEDGEHTVRRPALPALSGS